MTAVSFSERAGSPGLVPPFCVPRATCQSTPCMSPVGRLGLRLGRGHFSVTGLLCFPPSELPRSSSSGDYYAWSCRDKNRLACACLRVPAAGIRLRRARNHRVHRLPT